MFKENIIAAIFSSLCIVVYISITREFHIGFLPIAIILSLAGSNILIFAISYIKQLNFLSESKFRMGSKVIAGVLGSSLIIKLSVSNLLFKIWFKLTNGASYNDGIVVFAFNIIGITLICLVLPSLFKKKSLK